MNQMKSMKQIVEFYGEAEQFTQAMEECSELIQAINKWRRKKSVSNYDNVVEEIADVEIMISQIKMILNIDEAVVRRLKDYKLSRQLERIEDLKKSQQESSLTIGYLEKIRDNIYECKNCGFCWNQNPDPSEMWEIINELIRLKRNDKN